jgi:hypothetical protein
MKANSGVRRSTESILVSGCKIYIKSVQRGVRTDAGPSREEAILSLDKLENR